MAKLAVVALCLASMLVAGLAVEEFQGFTATRKLQQALTCAQAPRLVATKNACTAIFDCAAPKDPRVKAAKTIFGRACDRCIQALAASPCGKGAGSPPKECSQGLTNKAVSDCLRLAAAGH